MSIRNDPSSTTDSGYYKKHEYRTPKQAPDPNKPKQRGRNGVNYRLTPDLERRFRSLWAQHVTLKQISFELEVGISTLSLWRERLELPTRKLDKAKVMHLHLPADMHRKLHQHCAQYRIMPGKFIRKILKRELSNL